MCGISGYIDIKNRDESLKKSLNTTKHRGPDNTSQISHKINDFHVGLGHNRLSIIDTSDSANQPMISTCKNYYMVFNGEIYNYKYLLSLLNDFQPKTSSDSEVLLEFFIQYGINGFKKVNGMFSVVFLDMKTSQLYIFRDPVGIKPIYLFQKDKKIYFSSEIKGLKPYVKNLEINKENLYEFFSLGYLIEPETGFKNVKKLMPGCFFQFDFNSGASFEDLYFQRDSSNNSKINIQTITDSIQSELMSDVKVGLFFSGGVDSSVVAAATNLDCVYINNPAENKVNTDKKSVDYFKTLNKNKVIEINSVDDPREPLEIMKFVAINTEDLVSDYTFYSVYRISKYVKDNGYKVMLSGMGADEVFLGYPRHSLARYHSFLKFFPFIFKIKFFYKRFEKFLPNKMDRFYNFIKESDFTKAYFNLIGYFSKDDLNQLLKPSYFFSGKRTFYNKIDKLSSSFNKHDSVNSKMWELDRLGFLSHNLMVSDKATMLNSIEMRVPLLNLKIFEKINSNLKSINWKSLINKNILQKYLSSHNMAYFFKRKKQGFNPDLNRLINSISKKEIEEVLINNELLDGLLNKDYIKELIDSHYLGLKNNSYKLWQLVYFYYWFKFNN